MAYKKIVADGTSCIWGVPFKSELGTISSFTDSVTSDKKELKDEGGTPVAVAYYNIRHNISFTLACKSSARAPQHGDKFETTDEGGSPLVGIFEDPKITYSQEDFKAYDINAVIYEKIIPTGNEEWEDHPESQLE